MKLVVSSIFLVGAVIIAVLAYELNSDFQLITFGFIVLSIINFAQHKSSN